MAKLIVGIGGSKQVGKTTCAKLFVDEYGFKELSFAYPLKKMCAIVFKLPAEFFDDQDFKEKQLASPIRITLKNVLDMRTHLSRYSVITDSQIVDMFNKTKNKVINTPRELMQFVGTELIRECVDYQFWCKALKQDMEPYSRVVIPDARFKNERSFLIEDCQARLIKIKRGDQKSDEHVSENQVGEDSEYDFVFENNDTIEELYNKVDAWFVGTYAF